MKIRAMRGGDQKGISFLSPSSGASLLGNTVKVSYANRSLLSDIRASKSVPEETIVLDSRLFDDLRLEGESEVEVEKVNERLPFCEEVELVYWVLDRVASGISMRSEDFRAFLDGRILKTGQKFVLPERGVTFRVERLRPTAASTQAARVGRKRPPRIEVRSGEEDRLFPARDKSTVLSSLASTEVPESVAEEKADTADNLLRRLAEVSRELDEIETLDLQRRIENLEGRMSSLTGTEGTAASETSTGLRDLPVVSGAPSKNLYVRLKEVVDRLESLSSRLEDLERRIETLAERKKR
ncbi:MAG: hypothetical protein C4K49_04240 [Candidatus Thorarchaeota archaeon]|nr:MAG: hypothetical protein C4K49_04240 [Candidatus Thorarchaeota archaeon]